MNRRFGVEIQNIVKEGSSNHIVLKSRSFSFENKNKVNSFVQGLPRRISYNKEKPLIIEDKQSTTENLPIPDYLFECVSHMMNLEKGRKNLYQTTFLKDNQRNQKQKKMLSKRSETLDWLVGIHYELKLFPQTLFAAVKYMDEYLFAKDNWDDVNIQLVGIASIFIAGKFQQTYRIPCLRQLKRLSSFTPNEIIHMEQKIVEKLNFELISDSSYRYMELLGHISDLSEKNTFIAQYILELSLIEPKFLQFKSSLIGSSVIYLVHKIRKISPSWPSLMIKVTGYDESELRHCAKQLCTLLQQSHTIDHSKSIRKKFSLSEFCEASKIRLQRKAQ